MTVLKLLLASRKVQLALVAIAAVVLMKVFKLDEAMANDLADKIVTLVAIVIAGIAAEDVAAKLKNTEAELTKARK